VLRHREQVNRGHEDRPLSNAEIAAKFDETVALGASPETAARVKRAVLDLGSDRPAAEFAEDCRGE